MPAAMHFSRSPCIACAVMATMMMRELKLGCPPAFWRSRISARRFQAVHFRHHHVHENQIIRLPVKRVERFPAVGGQVRLVAQLLQDAHGNLLIDGVVVAQQDAQRLASASGWSVLTGGGACAGAAVWYRTGRGSSTSKNCAGLTGLVTAKSKERVASAARACRGADPSGVSNTSGSVAAAGNLMNFGGQGETVHAGHLHVEDGQIK